MALRMTALRLFLKKGPNFSSCASVRGSRVTPTVLTFLFAVLVGMVFLLML